MYWGLFWLMFTPTIGVTISALFNYPDYLGTSEYLTFGRLRPMHVNGVIFGAFSTLFIGAVLLPRAAPVRRARCGTEEWGHWLVWVWNLGLIAGMASLHARLQPGPRGGRVSAADRHVIFFVITVLTVQFLMTIAQRREPQLYVALWYLIGAFVWTVLNLVLGSFILPYTITGINSAAFHGLFIHYIVGPVDHAGGLRADLLLPAGQREEPDLQPQALAGGLLVAGACSTPSSASTTTCTARSPTGPRRCRSSPRCC